MSDTSDSNFLQLTALVVWIVCSQTIRGFRSIDPSDGLTWYQYYSALVLANKHDEAQKAQERSLALGFDPHKAMNL